MKHVFKVGDSVFARVIGFEPFPATVESVLLNESDSSVFYYVRFNGGSQTVPIDANNLLLFSGVNKKLFRFKYNENELKKEAKLRTEALLGADDDIPEVLMNFVTVDSDFEEVSNETVKRLGLYSITLTSHMVKTLDNTLSTKLSKLSDAESSDAEDDFVDVEEIPQEKFDSSTTCSNCNITWSSPRSLYSHLRQTKCGSILKKKEDDNKDHLIRKMWNSRSVLGYYNCKLCYRRFRSKGEAQAHMSSKHRGIMKNVKIKVAVDDDSDDSSDSDFNPQRKTAMPKKKNSVNHSSMIGKRLGEPPTKILKLPVVSNSNANSSDSDSISQNRSADKHSSMERERRKALASKFEALSEVLSLQKGSAKVKILDVAGQHIRILEHESENNQKLLENLKTLNAQLKSRYLELKKSQNC